MKVIFLKKCFSKQKIKNVKYHIFSIKKCFFTQKTKQKSQKYVYKIISKILFKKHKHHSITTFQTLILFQFLSYSPIKNHNTIKN